MSVEVFLDTNVLVYAHDRHAGEKHERAKLMVETFWMETRLPYLSMQVLQELHVNLVKKGTEIEKSAQIVSRYLSWRIIETTRHLFAQALMNQRRWMISFWDAMILSAAQRAGASELWTEDLNDGQDYDGVKVVNPFKGLE